MGSGASTRSRQGSAMSDEWVVLVGICVEGGLQMERLSFARR
jgi:hypothetical protein